ncbi:MAG: hypothetical protein MUD13_05925 [Candidatus Nanopelagicales bacterium]|nr:hypothetical protein [Candidatus Nanopelagicales bacterium]
MAVPTGSGDDVGAEVLMMRKSTREYDAFGPWVYEIRTEDEIPKLYREFPLDLASAAMTIKVPREIERRDANPDMDLYDVVLSVGPDHVTVLTRQGHRFDFRDVPYRDLQGITESVDLLDGRLVLAAEGGDVRVKYNASSNDVMTQLVGLLRERYIEPAPAPPPGTRSASVAGPPDVERELQVLFRRVSHEGPMRTAGVQRRHVVLPVRGSSIDRAVARAWPTALQSAIFILSATELQVLHRGRPYRTGFRPIHTLARTLLPLERVAGIETAPSERFAGVAHVRVRVGHVTHEFALDDPVADRVVAALRTAVRG